MTPEIALLLAIVVGTIVLFALEPVPAEVTGLGVMLALILTGILTPAEGFSGFGSDTIMMILGLLIMTSTLSRTGVVDMAGRAILRRAGTNPRRLLVLVTLSAAALSAFISNTAAAAMFLPIVLGVALKSRTSASRFLLPMAFATILTSSVTLISTSSNMVVSGLLTRYGQAPIGMFELAPVGIPIAITGVIYLLTVGRRLLPERDTGRSLSEEFGLGPYLSEVLVKPGSGLVGKTLLESGFGRELDLRVLRILRGGKDPASPRDTATLREGDVLIVEGDREEILRIKDVAGLEIRPDVELSVETPEREDQVLAEALVLPGSALMGRTLKAYGFLERHGLQVLAIHRHGATLRDKLSQVRLRLGDALLLQGGQARLVDMEAQNVLRVVGAETGRRPRLSHAGISVAIFGAAVLLASFDVLPVPVAFMTGAFVALATRCITPQEAYQDVEWKVLILIGSMLALGTAMEDTGAAQFLAGRIIELTGDSVRPVWLLTGVFALTVLLTQPMSNQAAAIVVLPIAIQTALGAGYNPRTFAMMVAVAASVSYLTPLEPACLMVYGPGRYRFTDFLRVGALLTLIVYGIAIVLVPMVWPPLR